MQPKLFPRCQQFISERQFVTNVSPATIKWYHMSLCWLTSETPTDADIKALVLKLRTQGRKVTTVNCRLRAINAFLHWNVSGDTKCGPGCQHVRAPRLKEEQRELPTFDTKDISRLLAWVPKTVTGSRLQTMVSVLCDTGARIDEVLSLRWSDIDFDNLLVLLHGKGRKDRRVPMSLALRKRLYLWQKKQAGSTFVFGTQGGEKQGHRNVLRDVKNLCRKLGFEPPPRTLHAFRHTFATNYLRQGGSVFHLQRALGHTTLDMTRRYAHLQTSDLQAVHEKFSLLGQAR